MIDTLIALDILKKKNKATELITSNWIVAENNKPAIYCNLKAPFKFTKNWSVEFFSKTYGNNRVIAHNLLTNQEDLTTLSTYLKTDYYGTTSNPKMCHWQCTPQNNSIQ